MVGADQDVVNSGGHELANHRENALAGAREVFELRVIAVEDRLRGERAVFVEIQKRLVRAIIGEERGRHRYQPRHAASLIARMQTNGLPVRQRLGRGPGATGQRPAAGGDLQAAAEQRNQFVALRAQHRWVEQKFWGIHAEFMRGVEYVYHEREIDRGWLNLDVQIAERHRMRRRGRRNTKEQSERGKRNEVRDAVALGQHDRLGRGGRQSGRNFHSAPLIGQQYTLSRLLRQCAGMVFSGERVPWGILSYIETRLSLTVWTAQMSRRSLHIRITRFPTLYLILINSNR